MDLPGAIADDSGMSGGGSKKSRKLGALGRALGDAFAGGLVRDLRGARSIALRPHKLPAGADCLLAPDLRCQHVAPDGTVQATRGYHLYELRPGSMRFVRKCHLPCPFGKAWMGHFSAARRHIHRSDVVDIFPLRSGAVLVSAGGSLYRGRPGEGNFQRVFKFRAWGAGMGRGIRSPGLAEMDSGRILFGEYVANQDIGPVHVYASSDGGGSWELVHVFPAGSIRHVHAIQQDPFAGVVWICTGDAGEHSLIAYSEDEGRTFHRIGGGSQLWRAGKVLFTGDYLYWGADTNLPEDRYIVRWSRKTGEVERLAEVGGPVLSGTRLAKGTWVFATDREGTSGLQWFYGPDRRNTPTEWDEIPSLWVSPSGRRWKRLELTRWLEEARPWFGVPQIAAGNGAPYLVFTCLNMERYGSDLIIIREEELRRWFDVPGPDADPGR